jgi:hypothetical protein
VIRSYEPGEDWFYSYPEEAVFEGPLLAPPLAHPLSQPAPGPEGLVPADWMNRLH